MWVSGGGEPFLALGLGPGAPHRLLPWAGWPDIPLLQENQSSPGSRAPLRSMTPRPGLRTPSPRSWTPRTATRTPTAFCTRWTGGVGRRAWHCPRASACRSLALSRSRPTLVFFSEDGDCTTDPEGHLAEEGPSAAAEDGRVSEPSDEEAPTLSAESGDVADEDTPGPDLPQEDGVDLLGLHSEAGPAPPTQARGGPPSNADLLSRLLGAPAAAPEGAAGGLLGGDAALLFTSPASAPSARTTVPAGRCRRQEWAQRSRQSAAQGDHEPPEDLLRQAGVSALPLPLGAMGSWEGRPGADPLG